MILKVIAFLFLIIGAIIVFSASWIVKRFRLDREIKINFEHSMEEEELANYKLTKAVINVKLIGTLVMLPGLILVFIAFK